jgi:hypothetical protein
MRDASRRGMGDVTFDQVRENFTQRHGSGEFQIVDGQKHETGRQFTTQETIAAGLATFGHMKRGQNTAEQGEGWCSTSAIHPDYADRLATHWQAIPASGQPVEIEG